MANLDRYMDSFYDELAAIHTAEMVKEAGLKDLAKKVPQLTKNITDATSRKMIDLHSKYPRVMKAVHEHTNDPDTMGSIANTVTKFFGH